MVPDPFGQTHTAKRPLRTADGGHATGPPSRAERLGRRAGTWAAQTPALRFAPFIVVAYDFTATLIRRLRELTRPRALALIMFVAFIALVVLAFIHAIRGEPGGPGF